MQTKPGAVIIEGHVQGLSNTRSLGEKGIPVYVVDKENCIARYSKYCNKFFRSPDFLSDEFADFLIDLAKRENIKDWVLIPSNDHAVYTISKHRDKLAQYYKVITPELDVIENIYDKSKLLKISENVGVPIPRTYYFKTSEEVLQEKISYPVLTRGRNGLSFYRTFKKKAFIAHNKNELHLQLYTISRKIDLKQTFTQEIIPINGNNKTISFTAFCENGEIKTYWMGAKLREHPIRFGTATFCESIYDPELLSISKPLLKALRYTGVCEVEYLVDPRDNLYKLIEINARTWLWVGLAKACGVDYAQLIYNYLQGDSIETNNGYKIGLKWRNIYTDAIFSTMGILKGSVSIKEFIHSLNGDIIDGIWHKKDPKPMIAYARMIPQLLRNR